MSHQHPWCRSPIALIIAPTHELCIQIEDQTKALAMKLPNIRTCLLIGGVPIPQQLYRLQGNVQVVVATPGRLNDIIENHCERLNLQQVRMVVLDEVDTMLQMGFEKQVSGDVSHFTIN